MSRVAAFVDAGYFWVQCSQILFNDKRRRGEIVLDVARMREKLLEVIRAEFPYASLLRVYWYDGLGSDGNPTEMHRRIYELDDFKVRYGTRNLEGKQKGIDGLLIADLIGLAQNHGITEALILSGDGDLAPGVAAAQTLGVRVHRLEMGGAEASSPALRAEVDRNVLWPRAEVESFVAPSPFRSESDEEDGQTAFGIGMEPLAVEENREVVPRGERGDVLLHAVAERFVLELEKSGSACRTRQAPPFFRPDGAWPKIVASRKGGVARPGEAFSPAWMQGAGRDAVATRRALMMLREFHQRRD